MILRRFLPAGFLLVLLAALPGEMFGAKPVYERFREAIEEEMGIDEGDEPVAPFIRMILKDQNIDISVEDVHTILQGKGNDVCGDTNADADISNIIGCEDLKNMVLAMAADELRIRVLGRKLQATATSYELPISDLPGRTLKLSADLRAIINIWSAGTGSIKSKAHTPQIRTYSPSEDERSNVYQSLFTDIGETLETMDEEEFVAAIWRYQYGVRFARGDRAPKFPAPFQDDQSGPGTERQYMFKRWDNLEENLMAIWAQVESNPFTPPLDPPLTSKESVYYTFPQEFFDETLPDNVIVWIRYDGDTENGRPFSDVGLQWQVPIEPLQPSLMKDVGEDEEESAIRGGDYPPEPIIIESRVARPLEGRGLCSSPIAARGYLCRPFEILSEGERCPLTEEQAEADTIQLVYCANPKGTWCCNPDSNSCGAVLNATQCMQDGGIPSADAQGCATNGCTIPEEEPVFCCLPGADKMCVETLNASLCTQRGGTASEDANGCRANGCNDPVDTSERFTAAGADVCREIKWKPTAFDPNKQCKVTLNCGCTPENGEPAEVSLKGGDGTITVCAGGEEEGMQTTYALFHGTVHAYQACDDEPGKSPYETIPDEASDTERKEIEDRNNALFCQLEGEAYRAMCAMMERDGVFKNDDGSVRVSGDGIPFNAETCTEAFTHFSVSEHNKKGCFTSRTYSQIFINDLREVAKRNPKNLPAECSEATDPLTMDERLEQLEEAAEARDDVCRPGQVNVYKNRIGNNACFIGQCVEMSVELHRIAGGADPFVVQGETAPWDDPQTGTPLGNALMNPPLSQAKLPAYMPERFMLELETALCQLQGLPPRTPPILCAIDARRQLELTRIIGAQTALSISTQNNETELSADDLLALSHGVGTRLGTEMYANYVRESNKSFAGIIDMASMLLEELEKIDFPVQMCPLEPGLPPSVVSN